MIENRTILARMAFDTQTKIKSFYFLNDRNLIHNLKYQQHLLVSKNEEKG